MKYRIAPRAESLGPARRPPGQGPEDAPIRAKARMNKVDERKKLTDEMQATSRSGPDAPVRENAADRTVKGLRPTVASSQRMSAESTRNSELPPQTAGARGWRRR
jgi:hypothetical protein